MNEPASRYTEIYHLYVHIYSNYHNAYTKAVKKYEKCKIVELVQLIEKS